MPNWNPLTWPKKWQIAGAAGVTIIVVAVIVGAVEGTKTSADNEDYPALNYTISARINGTSFFDHFDYYTETDPSSGFVTYVDESTASWYNLTYASESSAVLKVDTTNQATSSGRNSVRITSKEQWDSGLFVFDVIHSPYGCGTWPAVWLSDPDNWPTNGEIDIIEAVEQGNKGNQMTLHTTEGCTMKSRHQTGTVSGKNCWNGTDDNAGCGVFGETKTYGEKLNENGGALFAVELRDAGIRVWIFERSSLPDDLQSSNDTSPDPSGWGTPVADFPNTHCDISKHFTNQSIIANIDLCGSWAGADSVYSDQYGCPGTCESYVQSNATAFDEAYWEFGSFRVWTAES